MGKAFKFIGPLINLSIFLLLPITTLAEDFDTFKTKSGSINLTSLKEEEMIHEIADSKKISIKEAQKLHPDRSIDLKNSRLEEKLLQDGISTLSKSTCGAVDPHRIGISLNVSSTYKPTLNIFV